MNSLTEKKDLKEVIHLYLGVECRLFWRYENGELEYERNGELVSIRQAIMKDLIEELLSEPTDQDDIRNKLTVLLDSYNGLDQHGVTRMDRTQIRWLTIWPGLLPILLTFNYL